MIRSASFIVVAMILLIIGMVGITGCAYDGGYRYPCQNPDNWETEECKPPKCTIWGTCPDDLVPSCGAMMGTDCKGV